MATKREMMVELAFCRDWFAAALDATKDGADDEDDEGVRWLNGDSNKYAGDAWTEAEKILKRLKVIVGR